MTQRPRVVDTSYTFVVTKKPKKAQKLPIKLEKKLYSTKKKRKGKGKYES